MDKTIKIKLTDENGNTGIAEVEWIPENIWDAAHYGAFISAPFQPLKTVNLFIYDIAKVEEAKEKAKEFLKLALARCTLCG